MPKLTIDVPEGFEEAVKALEETLKRAQAGVVGAQSGDMAAFDAAWQAVDAGVEETERQMKRRLLRALDFDAPCILIDGKPYAYTKLRDVSRLTVIITRLGHQRTLQYWIRK